MSLVLVADDEPAVLEVLTEVVEDLGHEVVRAHDGREALMIARSQAPNLVVTDHMMPRLSGVELCRALREDDRLRQVPVILLSAALPPEAVEAHAFLSKPFELDEFESLVKRTLEGVTGATPPAKLPAKLSHGQAAEELINWVAHEIKTPLAAAKMNLQLLERRLSQNGQPPDRGHFISVARQLDGMEQIVNALLDASKLAEGHMEVQLQREELREVVQQVVGQWRELYPDFQVELLMCDESLEARCDRLRIMQIVGNLISNAVKYGSPPKHVRVELVRVGMNAELRVQDFGPGISAADQRHIFQRFRSAESGRAKGHGLGLYIANELAKLQGGSIAVRSSLGQGATFTVSLPLAT